MEWERTKLLFGDDLDKIQHKTIVVIGLGGVGSYVVESLARLGIRHLILVDGDTIDISNINRQLFALHSTIGRPKVEIAKERVFDISPSIQVDVHYKTLLKEDVASLLDGVDYVVDACDTVEVKKEIIRICTKMKIRFISCMGTGRRIDPSKVMITDIRKTSYDPIARKLRKMVRDEKIVGNIPVVCSREAPIKHEGEEIASCSFVPSIAGLLCTGYIVQSIIGELYE